MIKTVVFTHYIDRTYLANIKKSKRVIKQTKSQNFSDLILKNDDKPDLIRKKSSFSDEERPDKNDIDIDTITDTDGLRKIAEYQEKQRELINSNPHQNSQKNSKINSTQHFLPTPPKNPVPPGVKRRSIPLHPIKNKISNEEFKDKNLQQQSHDHSRHHKHHKSPIYQ